MGISLHRLLFGFVCIALIRVKWFLRRSFLKTLEQGAATTLCMALHPVPTPAVGEDMTEALCVPACCSTTHASFGGKLQLSLLLAPFTFRAGVVMVRGIPIADRQPFELLASSLSCRYWSDCEPVGSDEEQPDRMYRELV